MGRALRARLLDEGHEVWGLARSESSLAHGRYTHLKHELADWETAALALDDAPEVLIHLAWAGSVGPARTDLSLQLANVTATEQAVLFASRAGCTRFVGVGTITEEEVAVAKTAPGQIPSAGFLYGVAKTAAQQASRYRAAELNMEHVWAQLGNVYSPNPGVRNFLVMALEHMVENRPLSLTAGTQSYDFVALEDALTGLSLAALSGRPQAAYYVGSGEAQPLRNFVLAAAELTATEAPISFGSASEAGVSIPAHKFSIEELQRDTGYTPRIPFRRGVLALAESLRA